MCDIDLSDADLDLSHKDIPSKHSVCLQDVFSVTIFRLPRRLGRRKIVTLKTS